MEIPARMKKFPLWRGFPVHFTVFVVDGIPDFKVSHVAKRTEAINKNLCSLCGERLTIPFAFIGGPNCIRHRRFVDGPMHEDCATYAAKTCPYLAYVNYKSGPPSDPDKHKAKHPEVVFETSPLVDPDRPERMALALTNTYEVVKVHGETRIKAGWWISVDWDIMPKRV